MSHGRILKVFFLWVPEGQKDCSQCFPKLTEDAVVCQGSLCFTLFGTSIVSCLLRCSELAASACRPWIFARSLLHSFRSASDGLVDHQLILPNCNLSGSVQLTLHSRWSCYCLTGFPFVRLAIYVLTRALVFPPATNGFCNFEAPGRRTAAFINTQVGAEVSGQGQLED